MADINKDVGAGHGAPDYATLTLWNAGEGAADPGATFLSIANCSGDCGTIANISGTFIRGADIRGDVTYDGTNESSLAFTTRLFTTADDINVFDMKITESNGFQDVYKPLGANSFATRCRIAHTGTPTINNGEINLTSTAANKGLISCVASTGGAQLIRHGFDRPATITNTIGFGATTRGMMFSGANQDYEDCYFYDCNSAAYVGSTGLVHCASDDLTATVGFQSIASTALVATGSDDYQSASGGALDVTPFIGAFLEVSSGVTVTATLGTIDYTSQNTTIALTGSVDVSTTLGTISYSSQNTVVSITGDIDVTATLGLIDYSSQNTTVSLSGIIAVSPTLGTINYSSQSTTISLTGDIDVIATLGAINYSSNNTVVSLSSEVIINATLGTIDYASQNTTVVLSGLVDVTATLGSIVYNSYPVTVQIGTGQTIGNVTAGFADDIYTAGFKPDTITVSFK